jgi:hypothetical protein
MIELLFNFEQLFKQRRQREIRWSQRMPLACSLSVSQLRDVIIGSTLNS